MISSDMLQDEPEVNEKERVGSIANVLGLAMLLLLAGSLLSFDGLRYIVSDLAQRLGRSVGLADATIVDLRGTAALYGGLFLASAILFTVIRVGSWGLSRLNRPSGPGSRPVATPPARDADLYPIRIEVSPGAVPHHKTMIR